jgi:hypothetical protein
MKYVRLSLDKKKGEAEEDNKRRNYDGEEHSRKRLSFNSIGNQAGPEFRLFHFAGSHVINKKLRIAWRVPSHLFPRGKIKVKAKFGLH